MNVSEGFLENGELKFIPVHTKNPWWFKESFENVVVLKAVKALRYGEAQYA